MMSYKKPKIKLKFLTKLKNLAQYPLFFILILISVTLPIISLFYIANYPPALSKEISNQTLGFLALLLYFTIANLLFIRTKIKKTNLKEKLFFYLTSFIGFIVMEIFTFIIIFIISLLLSDKLKMNMINGYLYLLSLFLLAGPVILSAITLNKINTIRFSRGAIREDKYYNKIESIDFSKKTKEMKITLSPDSYLPKKGDFISLYGIIPDSKDDYDIYNLKDGEVDTVGENYFTIKRYRSKNKSLLVSVEKQIENLKQPKSKATPKRNKYGYKNSESYFIHADRKSSLKRFKRENIEAQILPCACLRCQPNGAKVRRKKNFLKDTGLINLRNLALKGFFLQVIILSFFYISGETLKGFIEYLIGKNTISIIITLMILRYASKKTMTKNTIDEKINPEIIKFIKETCKKVGAEMISVKTMSEMVAEKDRAKAIKNGMDTESNAYFLVKSGKKGLLVLGHAYQEKFDDITKGVIAHEIGHANQRILLTLLPALTIIAAIAEILSILILIHYGVLAYLLLAPIIPVIYEALSANVKRKIEKGADLFAIKVVGKKATLAAFRALEKNVKTKDSSLLVKIFSSHPSTSERIKYIESYLEKPNEIKKK